MTARDVDTGLSEAFRPIAKDLGRAGLRTELRPASDAGVADVDAAGQHVPATPLRSASLIVDGDVLGIVSIDPVADVATNLHLLADQVQDLVLEFARQDGRPVVWPACREGHRHPMSLSPLSVGEGSPDRPTWTCPSDPDHRAPVGDLG